MSERSGSRGRVVMLVDNNVTHDSRVQKQASSAAEMGWDVILLGTRRVSGEPDRWNLGEASVRLLTVPTPMRQRRHEYRRAPLRSPFAYQPGKLANYRLQESIARKTDLRFRLARLSRGHQRLASLRRMFLTIALLFARLHGRWVAFRHARTMSLRDHRRVMDRPIDRLTTLWWQRTMGNRAWRKLGPGLWDWELAYGPVIDKLKPDIIHANDFRMLAIGARAATRGKAAGRNARLVWDAHEFLPGQGRASANPRWHLAHMALEREFSGYADAVVTVSERLADLLVEEHGLTGRPAIVLNTPDMREYPIDDPIVDIRAKCGLATETPLMVYSGSAAPQRGIDVIVESMPDLEGVHVALVVNAVGNRYVASLLDRARELGVTDRLHVLPFVPVKQIVPFLSTADIGIHPLIHLPNHEISLATKFYEYSHARLPILASDVKTMAETVRATGQGEVFRVGDLDDFVQGAKAILADPGSYRKAYEAPGLLDEWTWGKQATALDSVYSKMMKLS